MCAFLSDVRIFVSTTENQNMVRAIKIIQEDQKQEDKSDEKTNLSVIRLDTEEMRRNH
jgi:hypothetical protein